VPLNHYCTVGVVELLQKRLVCTTNDNAQRAISPNQKAVLLYHFNSINDIIRIALPGECIHFFSVVAFYVFTFILL
jgi:hypothetical protein